MVHLLELATVQRAHYTRLGALAVDANGHEVFLGLDEKESGFLVACRNMAPDTLTDRQRTRFAMLMARHERSRLANIPGADRGMKNEASQG